MRGGARGFPNLTDNDWLCGGEPETIKTTITDGRIGVMPALAAGARRRRGVKDVAHYVPLAVGACRTTALRAQRGKAKFAAICAACHGPDGKGNQALGAPNLTDSDLAVRRLRGDDHREHHQGPHRARCRRYKDFLGEAKVHCSRPTSRASRRAGERTAAAAAR